MKYHHDRVGELKAYFIGAIEKIGLLPGFIATIAAFVGALNGENWLFINALSIAIGITVGIYLAIAPTLFASVNIKQYGFILEEYLKLSGK